MARSISKSVGRGGVNLRDDVLTVQELLNAHIAKLAPMKALVTDGKFGPATEGGIVAFQRKVIGMSHPDGRVDPGGKTLAALNQSDQPAKPPTGVIRVTFQHGGVTPPNKIGGKVQTADLYESTVTISGGAAGSFRGSIYPDDMSERGRLKDGTYDLYLGFHKRQGGAFKPTSADLTVRSEGSRAALVVNADKAVPVISNKAGKTTSEAIHIHNGFNSQRFSDGCPTILPSDWSRFIKTFLDAFPNLSSWQETNTYVGKKIGTLEIKS